MNVRALWIFLALLLLPVAALADESGRFSYALAFGNFDADTEESDDPHLNEISYSLLLSGQVNRLIALDAEIFSVEFASETDIFDTQTAFGGDGAALTARLGFPLDDDFNVYLRGGWAHLKLDDGSRVRETPIESSQTQPVLGLGLRGRRWFAEYVNYGEIEGLHLEQLRVGVVLRF